MKKLLSIVIALCLVLAMSLTTFASKAGRKYTQNGIDYVETASVTLADLKRLEDVINGNQALGLSGVSKDNLDKQQDHTNSGAHIINAKALNSAGTEWAIRIQDGSESTGNKQNYNGDYYVSLRPYYWNNVTQEVVNAPSGADTQSYGPSWFYCGLFEDGSHNITGFAVAQRIKRWSGWNDLSFAGRKWNPQRDVLGVTDGWNVEQTGDLVSGYYTEPSSDTFLADHGVQ